MLISQSQSNAAADTLPDIQARPDRRGIELDSVGIDGLRIPATLVDVDGLITRTIVTVSAGVAVRASEPGTHMSRLVEELQLLNGPRGAAAAARRPGRYGGRGHVRKELRRVESQESIHNHQAFAFLEDRPGDTYGAVPRLKRGAKALSQLVASQNRKP
jgi:hypothetical protein